MGAAERQALKMKLDAFIEPLLTTLLQPTTNGLKRAAH